MSGSVDSRGPVDHQYADASNLAARRRLHARFSTNTHGWHRWVFDQLDLRPRCAVLEVGCGGGALWLDNSDRIPAGWDIVLSDRSAGMLAEARQRLRLLGRGFAFGVFGVQDIPFPDARFDAVIANHMLYHVPDLDRAIGELRRVLRPTGRLYAATNGAGHMAELHDLIRSVAPQATVGWTQLTSFELENGADPLAHHFGRVTVARYDDALAVTEVEPLVAYVLSVEDPRAPFSDGQVARLRRRIADRIAHAGAVHITKCSGLFAAMASAPRPMRGGPHA